MSNNGDDEFERRLRDVLLLVVLAYRFRRTPSIASTPVRVDVSNGGWSQQRRRLRRCRCCCGCCDRIGARTNGHESRRSAASSSSFAPLSASPVPLPAIVSESTGRCFVATAVVASSAPWSRRHRLSRSSTPFQSAPSASTTTGCSDQHPCSTTSMTVIDKRQTPGRPSRGPGQYARCDRSARSPGGLQEPTAR